jgi:cell division protein FtsW
VSRAATIAPRARPHSRRRLERPLQLEYVILVLVTLALVAFGLVMVYSASSARAAVGADDSVYFLKRQAIYAVIGLLLFVLLSRLDYRKLRGISGPLLAASLFLLVAVLVIGTSVNGARRWLIVGPVSIQPSELAKLALAIWIAAFLVRRGPPRTFGELLRPIGLVSGFAALLVLLEPDLGTAISFAVIVGAALLVAGTPMRLMGLAAGALLAVVLLASWLEPYRRARLFSFLNPWDDAQGAGFQSVQALIAMGSGGVFGVGLGESVQKVYYLPEATTDMIFAIVGEELGLVGSAAVILAFALFAYAGFSIALRVADPFAKLLAASLTALVCGQAAVNLAAVLGLAPLTGIPLPFVSYGGSSLIVCLVAAGILLTIARNSGAAAARNAVPDRRRGDGRTRPARARDRGGPARPRRGRELRRFA